MSLTVAELRYLFTGNTAKLDAAYAKADAGAVKSGRVIKTLAKTTTLAFAAVGVGVGAALVKGTDAAVSFQREMTKVHTQAGASAKDVAVLSRQVLALGRTTQQGPEQLAEGLYHLKSLGLDNVGAMKALRQASNLAAISGANLEDATNALGGAWRSGIKGAQSFSKTVSTLNAIAGAGNMRMQDLVSAMSSGILPAAKTFGVSLSSVGSALALMTDEGIPAVDAATRLRMTLSLMGAPSGVAEKALKSIGLTGTKLANAMRGPEGLIGAVQMLQDHIHSSGLNATQAAQVISKAFGGGRSSSAIMTMLNNLTVLKQKQDQINSSMGKFGPAVKAQQKTASAQLDILKSNLDVIGIKIGNVVLPAVTGVVKFINSTGLPAVRRFASGLAHLIPVQAISSDISKAEALLRRLFGLGQGKAPKPKDLPFKTVLRPDQVKDLPFSKIIPLPKKPMDLPFSRLFHITGGSNAATGILSGINWSKVIGSAIRGAVGAAGQIGAAILGLMKSVNWTDVGKQAAFAMVPFVIGLVNNLVTALISEAVHHPIDMLLFISSLIPIGRAAGLLGKLFEDVPLLGKLIGWLTGPLEKAGGFVERTFGRVVLKALKGAVDFVAPGLRKKITDLVETAGIWIADKAIDFYRAAVRLVKGLWSGVESVRDWLYGKIKGVASGLVGLFGKAGRWLLGAGKNLISGLLSGIKNAMSGIGDWVKSNIVDPVVSWVKHHFGIHSPSRVMHGIGSHLMTGLFRGIMSHDLGGFVSKVFGSLPKALAALVGKGLVSIGSLPGKALKLLGGLGGKLGGLFGGGGSSGANVNLGRAMASAMGWTGAQFDALNQLWTRESGWNSRARNPSSGAYGIPQALPASKMASAGADWLTNAATQIKWGLGYIAGRYGSPLAAWAHETKFGWYEDGSLNVPQTGPAIVHKGEMIFPADVADAIRRGRGNAYTGNLSGKQLADLFRDMKNAVVKQIQAAKQFAASVASNARSYAGLGGIHGGTMNGKSLPVTSLNLVRGLGSKLAGIRRFAAAIKKLINRGLSGALVRQIANMDPVSGLEYANAILNGPAKYLRQLNRDERLIGRASGRLGRIASNGVYDNGPKAGHGFLSGLKAQEKAIDKLLARVADKKDVNHFSVRVFIGDKEVTKIIDTRIKHHDRHLNRKIKSGSAL